MTNVLTIFSTPRPFSGPFDLIQRNAIESWIKTCPGCDIILFEDEEKTTSKVASEFGIKCITDVERDEFGTPLLSDVYNKVKEIANSKIIVHINTDIILTDSFLNSIVKMLKTMDGKPFFMSGRRWDLNIDYAINFNEINWHEKIIELAKKSGNLHSLTGMDYWVLPKNLPFKIPPFVIGRPGMDSWLVYKSKTIKIPVVDATEVIDIIHQNHNYPQKNKHFFKIEKERNIKIAGGLMNMFTLREADFLLTGDGLKKPKPPRLFFSSFALFYPWRILLLIKRLMFYSSAYK